MKTLLITGASGFLGWNVCGYPQPGWRLVGTYFQNSSGIPPKTENLKLDLTDKDSIWRVLKAVKPDAVFHLAAFSNTNFCEKHPEETHAVNVTATAHLAEMCADRRARLVFTSSEQVHDGLNASYGENDAPSPRNEYGKQKLEAEERLTEIYPEAAIARIAVLYGKSGDVSKSFLQQWLESWQTYLPVTAFHDEIRSFLSARSAMEGLFTLLEQDACGIFNLAGEAPMSRYDFALLAKDIFNLPTGSVIAKSQQEFEMAAYRPPNLTLDTRKISSTGFQPRHPAGELRELAHEIILPPGFSEN